MVLGGCTGLDHEWGVDQYGVLLETGGGKERMTRYFSVRVDCHHTENLDSAY